MNTTTWLKQKMGKDKFMRIISSCHDCKKEVDIEVQQNEEGNVISDHPIWYMEGITVFFKCLECFKQEPLLTNYQPCEVFSRVVGYLRPVGNWNKGKKEEFKLRKEFKF